MKNITKGTTTQLEKYFLLTSVLFLFLTLNNLFAAQSENGVISVQSPPPEKIKSEEEDIYVEVDEQPEFPGGREAMREWFSDNIPPALGDGHGIPRLIVSFIVEKDGSLSDIQIVRALDPSIDKAAIKAVELMPKWKPGVHKGDTVRVRYVTPVNFRFYLETIDELSKVEQSSDHVFDKVDKEPEFPGGAKALVKWLSENIDYHWWVPGDNYGSTLPGRVITSFIVEKDGTLSDIKVDRGIDPFFDKEALKVVKAMPKWKPGVNKGDTVRVRRTLPILFKLHP